VCSRKCSLYVYSDTAFDIHYLDHAGIELSPEAALRVVGETAARQSS
jgi:hypothetical protein